MTDRADLTEWALSGPVGFHNQVTQGILADGAWYEGSASYHFYSLAPLLWHARASEGTETDLRPVPQIRAMLSAPFQWAYPDLTLPACNDCWYPQQPARRVRSRYSVVGRFLRGRRCLV